MDDVLTVIYNQLIKDPVIAKEFNIPDEDTEKSRIKYYEYPDTGEVDKPFLVIDLLDSPDQGDFADNTWLTDDYLVQIDVWSKERVLTKDLFEKVRKAMWELNFGQYGGGVNQWDKKTGIYRIAKRFRGKVYRNITEGVESKNG